MAAPEPELNLLHYRPLDVSKNELRVLKIHQPKERIASLFGRDTVTCSLKYVSLDDHTPEYAEFLRLDGAAQPPLHRAIFWSYITSSDAGKSSMRQMEQASPGGENAMQTLISRALAGPVDRPAYRDSTRYNEATWHWSWGELVTLSYQWGDESPTAVIVVDGTRVAVTRNLAAALRCLRDNLLRNFEGEIPYYVWADAVCINQRDIPERNEQVKRMKEIYAEASSVCIWTGGNLPRGRFFVKAMDRYLSERLGQHQPGLLGQTVSRTMARLATKAWITLVERPYWQRVWIMQEFLLANTSATVFFGNRSCLLPSVFVSSQAFSQHAVRALTKMTGSAEEIMEKMRVFSRLEELGALDRYKYHEEKAHPDLMVLLEAIRNSNQKDARDKVYAILGLVDPGIRELVKPDYGAPLRAVYQDFVLATIRATRRLEVVCQGSCSAFRNPDFPSWVPDLTIITPDNPVSFSLYANVQASGDVLHKFVETDASNHLICDAMHFDDIAAGGCTQMNPEEQEHDVHDTFQDGQAPGSTPRYEDAGQVRKAIWEVLSLGLSATYKPEVAKVIEGIPWFNEYAIERETSYYQVVDQFQQCNKKIRIDGKPLRKFFPKYSRDYADLPDDPSIVSEMSLLMSTLVFRRLFLTRKGYLGIGPRSLASGDEIFAVAGSRVPLVLRPDGQGGFKIVGDCYVHGIMHGELLTVLEGENASFKPIVLS